MGTYINIDAHLVMKPENEKFAVQAVRDLNKRDDLKRGGSSIGEKWFSWIPEKYEDDIHTIEDVFGAPMLGFDVVKNVNDNGLIVYDMHYCDKWGQHELFFLAVGPFMEEMTIEHYCDELEFPNQTWRIELNPVTKKVHIIEPVITVEYPVVSDSNEVTYDYFKPYSYAG